MGLNLGRAGGQVERLFLRQLVGGRAELFQYHYSLKYYARRDRTGTQVSRPPITTVNAAASAHPQLASPRFTTAIAHPLAFPPLSGPAACGNW